MIIQKHCIFLQQNQHSCLTLLTFHCLWRSTGGKTCFWRHCLKSSHKLVLELFSLITNENAFNITPRETTSTAVTPNSYTTGGIWLKHQGYSTKDSQSKFIFVNLRKQRRNHGMQMLGMRNLTCLLGKVCFE